MKKFTPKVNDNVAVCYDGKWGRRVSGKVIAIKGFMIQVRFKKWASDDHKNIDWWFPRQSDQSYGCFVVCDDSLMKKLFNAKGDWYSVYSNDAI